MGKIFSSVEKVLDILSIFDAESKELSVREISRRLDLPLSSAYKYIDVLIKRGFLSKDKDTKKLSLGFIILRLADQVDVKTRLIDAALPHMHSLSKRSGETISLAIVNGWEGLCIEKIESPKKVKLTVERGSSISLHAGAGQKVCLAYQKSSFLEKMIKATGLPRLCSNTITDPEKLKSELLKIRKQGFALSNSEVDSGASAVAAPIFNHKAQLEAGLTLSGPKERIKNEDLSGLIEMVKDSASKISHDLGYREDTLKKTE
ncbi:IclR family transcriptional regulator [Thermodesulfobacteriota bacterium]